MTYIICKTGDDTVGLTGQSKMEVFYYSFFFFGEGLCWSFLILGKNYGEKVDVRKVIWVKFTSPGIQIQVFQGNLENVNLICLSGVTHVDVAKISKCRV